MPQRFPVAFPQGVGRLQTSSWVDKTTNTKRYKTEIVARQLSQDKEPLTPHMGRKMGGKQPKPFLNRQPNAHEVDTVNSSERLAKIKAAAKHGPRMSRQTRAVRSGPIDSPPRQLSPTVAAKLKTELMRFAGNRQTVKFVESMFKRYRIAK